MRLWYGQKEIRLADLGECPIFSGSDFAELMGVTPQRVRQWAKAGMPRVTRGKYPLIGCIRWHARYAKECRSKRRRSRQKERYLRLRAELFELRLQEITGNFVARELIDGRKYLVRALDRHLGQLPFMLGRELGLPSAQISLVRDRVDEIRNAIVGAADYFISHRM